MIQSAKPVINDQHAFAWGECLRKIAATGRLALGEYTERFERAWQDAFNALHAVALSSGSAGLEIALRHINVRGRKVLCPANTFVAVPAMIERAGGIPIFIDLDPATWGMKADRVINAVKIVPAPAAVVWVHTAGLVDLRFGEVIAACADAGVKLIEDASHAHGATWFDTHVGTFGDYGVFSLYPTKIITAGVGGMLVTHDSNAAAFARSFRHHGAHDGRDLSKITINGANDYMMSEANAALGRLQLSRLGEFNATRAGIVSVYEQALADIVTLPVYESGSVFYKYPVMLASREQRDYVRKYLRECAIESGVLYDSPVYHHPGGWYNEWHAATCPDAETFLPRQLALPVHAAMSPDDALTVASAVRAAIES